MSTPAPPKAISLSPADRAALERLARGESRAAFRAKAVLALADGESVAGTARRLKVTPKTVRAARARFFDGGADALREKPRGGEPEFPVLHVSPPSELANWTEGGARGRPPRARRKIETWVRDAAALGLLRPGARLPDRDWFRREFHATPGLVQSAFAELAAQGFVRSVPGVATLLARRLPFAGRYLLGILPKRDDQSREGLDVSLLHVEISGDRSLQRFPDHVCHLARSFRSGRPASYHRPDFSALPPWWPPCGATSPCGSLDRVPARRRSRALSTRGRSHSGDRHEMTSILLSESPPLRAYSEATLAALRGEAGLASRATPFTRADVLAGAAADADAIFSSWGMPEFTAGEIAAYLPRLRALFYAAGSVQGFARPFLERGVRVYSAWRENAVPVAEVAVSQILLANKGFFQACRRNRSRAAREGAAHHFSAFPGNFDCRVGLLGCGGIGRLVAEALRAHRVEVLVFDPFLSDEAAASLGVRKASLDEIFATCQTVSNHLANNAQTRGMLGHALFSRMLPNATFINTGRGAQVVEADLVRALEEAPDRTAVLDVTWPEPPEDGSPLYSLPNVFLTPHLAGSSGNEVRRMGEAMLEEFRAWRADPAAPSRREVKPEMLETMA